MSLNGPVRASRRRLLPSVAVAGVLLAAASCSSSSEATPQAGSGGGDGSSSRVRGTITVYADSSLEQVMPRVASDFTGLYPKTKVDFVFGRTSSLVSRLPGSADVIAVSGSEALEGPLTRGLVDNPAAFARDPLALAVSKGNPAGINQLSDVQKDGVTLAVCDSGAGCGQAARTLLTRNDLHPTLIREPDSDAVLAAVRSGDADAGLAQSRALQSASSSTTALGRVPISTNDTDANLISSVGSVTFYAAEVTRGSNEDTAQAFLGELGGDEGLSELNAAGFGR